MLGMPIQPLSVVRAYGDLRVASAASLSISPGSTFLKWSVAL
jgi:hypothetical protein